MFTYHSVAFSNRSFLNWNKLVALANFQDIFSSGLTMNANAKPSYTRNT